MISKYLKIVPHLWGEEKWIVNTNEYCGKIIILNKGWQSSFHLHLNKDETFYIRKGKVCLEVGIEDRVAIFILESEDSYRIKPGTTHRFRSLTKQSEVIEFSTHHEDSDTSKIVHACKAKRLKGY